MILCGTYNKTLFREEKTGFTIFSFITKDYDEYKNPIGNIICAGISPMYTIGVPIKMNGEFNKTSKGTYKFNFTDITEYSNEKDILISYISSNKFKGIGEKIAEKVVDKYGPNIFLLAERKDAIEEMTFAIPEINKEKATTIIRTIQNTTIQKKIYDYIYKFGGDYLHASELYSLYGINALNKIKENCYKTGISAGMPFETCDAIAKENGCRAYDKNRIEALFEYTLKALHKSGNIYSNLTDITNMANFLILNSAFKDEQIPQCLMARAAYNSNQIIIEEDEDLRFYCKPSWIAEDNIVKNLRRIHNNKKTLRYDPEIIEKIENNFKIKYSANQKEAFNFLKTSGIKILTGGPGTGKTTVINGLICAYKHMYPDNIISLCAPTGRAAQRMSESTKMVATTIHKLLDLKPNDTVFTCRDQSNPLPADLIIIDEMSMVDESVFSMLTGAIKDSALVLFCGDVDQLPSVGAGNVLNDLIESGEFEVDKLDVVYRQTGDSSIIHNANVINQGLDNLKTDKTFKIIEVETEEEMQEEVLSIIKEKYNPANPFDVQVLSSTKRGKCGVYQLNKIIQEMCNHNSTRAAYGTTKYKLGDKIVMHKNNYDVGYINGDVGIITEINDLGVTVNINDEEILIEKKLLSDMSLAYDMTIHKSQGSEYKTVVIALPKFPAIMLKRNLLYTAITRAKTEVIIVTQKDVIKTAAENIDNKKRKTMLKEKICGYIPTLIK